MDTDYSETILRSHKHMQLCLNITNSAAQLSNNVNRIKKHQYSSVMCKSTKETISSLKWNCLLVFTTRENTHNQHQHHRTEINNDKEEGDHSQREDAPHPPVLPSAGETNTLTQSILGENIIFLMRGLKAPVAFLLN